MVALASLPALMSVSLSSLNWATLNRAFGVRTPVRVAAPTFLVGQLGRYLPGGLWTFVTVSEFGKLHGMPRRQTLVTSTAFIIVMILTGLLTGTILLGFESDSGIFKEWWHYLILTGCIAFLHPKVAGLIIRVVNRGRGAPIDLARPKARSLALALSLAVGTWALQGAHLALLTSAFGAEISFFQAAGAYSLAWVAGFIVIFAPAGVGAREGALLLLLSPPLSLELAVSVGIAARLISVGVDACLGAGSLLYLRLGPKLD